MNIFATASASALDAAIDCTGSLKIIVPINQGTFAYSAEDAPTTSCSGRGSGIPPFSCTSPPRDQCLVIYVHGLQSRGGVRPAKARYTLSALVCISPLPRHLIRRLQAQLSGGCGGRLGSVSFGFADRAVLFLTDLDIPVRNATAATFHRELPSRLASCSPHETQPSQE